MRLLIMMMSVLILARTTTADDARPIQVGLQKQLLADDYVIAEARKVERVLGRFEEGQ